MGNTLKQRKKIEQELYSRFRHPSPQLERKWKKRRAIMGDGQDVRDLEYAEWMRNEDQEVIDLMDNYAERIANEAWNKKAFQSDVLKAHEVYLKDDAFHWQNKTMNAYLS